MDIVDVLTGSVNVTDYIKKIKRRDAEFSKGWGQIVTPPFQLKLWEGIKR